MTPAGHELVERLLDQRLVALQSVLEPLSPRERATLGPLLEQLLGALTENRQSARHICRLYAEAVCEPGVRCPVDLAAAGHERGEDAPS